VDEVVIGEAVVLEVPFARFPSRMVALVIDLLVQSVLLVVAFVVTAASMAGGLDQASGAAVWLACFVLIIVGYPVIFETTAARSASARRWCGRWWACWRSG
jgi:uncharacterized RDD family membrane protein YckC